MKQEVCFLIGRGGAVLWADASGDPVALPDSRQRWETIWRLRDELEEIAHSHPDGGAAFSHEDETTMAALESALGKRLRFSVVAADAMIARAADEDEHGERDARPKRSDEPWWAALLRAASGMTPPPPEE